MPVTTLCVAVGLWLQHSLLRSSTVRTTERQVWSNMEVAAAEFLPELAALEVSSPATDRDTRPATQTLPARKPPPGYRLTIVDHQWRTVVQHPSVDDESRAALRRGQSITWTPCSRQVGHAANLVRGTFETADGPQIAVACALENGQGHLLLHRSVKDIEAAAAPLVQALLPTGVVALLWTVTLLSLTVYLIMKRYDERLDHERAESASGVLRQTQRLIRMRDAVIFALAKLAGSRDDETGSHLERLSDYSTLLASALRHHPKFADQATPAFVSLIGLSAVPHDIGKVGIEDGILRKPGRLTPAERERMEMHTVIAGKCLEEIAERLGSSNFLEMAREIALAHHEHWDGTGYPNGLRGEEIPLSARVVAIADVYDALSTPRVYKDALPHEQCVAMIRAAAGQQFDPDLVEVWLTVESKFREIASHCLDHAKEPVGSRFRAEAGAARGDKEQYARPPAPQPADKGEKLPAESPESFRRSAATRA